MRLFTNHFHRENEKK